jgi:hypothetical protein
MHPLVIYAAKSDHPDDEGGYIPMWVYADGQIYPGDMNWSLELFNNFHLKYNTGK